MNRVSILAIEDDPLQRKLIKENLEQKDYVVYEAASGSDALAIIAEFPDE